MRLILILTFTLCLKLTFGCVCDHRRALTGDELKQTYYMALVKVKDVLPFQVDSTKEKYPTLFFKILIEEITLYKGKSMKEVIVQSGHAKFKTWTSCDIEMYEEQEWVIFASSLNDIPVVYPCGRSVIYRDENGLRDWKHKTGFKEISFLDSAFNRPTTSKNIKKGRLIEYFPNGQLERSENFKKWLRHGKVKYFFPNGIVYGTGSYYEGKPDKKLTWYYKDGTTMLSEVYDKGKKIDTTIFYTQTRKGNHPYMISVYSKTGQIVFSRTYSGFNSTPYISDEFVFDPLSKKSITKYYYDNGQLSSVETRINGQMEYIEYEKNGEIKKQYKQSENR